MSPLKQTKITDYFKLHKAGWPRQLLGGGSLSVRNNGIRTILDFPNEILLYILELQGIQPTELNSATQLYAVCRRFHSVYAQYAFSHLSCVGTKQLFLFNQSLKEQKTNLSPARVTLAISSLQ
jgi:hypothetical protein